MQWPPTSPGLYCLKFHFELAASMTSFVSMPILSNINASSFMNDMLTSLCAFSMAFDASATFMELALNVSTSRIEE